MKDQGSRSHPSSLIAHPSSQPAGCIADWHVLIAGFLQGPSRPTGLEKLWQRLRSELGNGTVAVELRPWNTCWDAFAEFIWRNSAHEMRDQGSGMKDEGHLSSLISHRSSVSPRVRIYAYSYGAGWGFPRLARALLDRGIEVERAVLSDPVYRHPLRIVSLLGQLFRWPIRVPPNVRDVWHFYQLLNWPRAHPLVAEIPYREIQHPSDPARKIAFGTRLRPPHEIKASHQYCDDHPLFHDTVSMVARLKPDDAGGRAA